MKSAILVRSQYVDIEPFTVWAIVNERRNIEYYDIANGRHQVVNDEPFYKLPTREMVEDYVRARIQGEESGKIKIC